MSDSMQPHRQQPTRLPHPWDSPGKNTGVGCHFLLQCMKVKSESEVPQSCSTLSNPMDCSPPGSSTHGIFQARVPEWGAIAFSARHQQGSHIKSHLKEGSGLLLTSSLSDWPVLGQLRTWQLASLRAHEGESNWELARHNSLPFVN